jgi:hypothetical protein
VALKMLMISSSLLVWAGLGCSGDPEVGTPEPPTEPWVDVGLTTGDDGLDFVSLEPGGTIPLDTFGQGGNHALMAVRCGGLGDRAFIGVTFTHLPSGESVTAPPTPDPRLLIPRGDGVYDLLPILVMSGGLVMTAGGLRPPGEMPAELPVRVRVEAENPAGSSASVERDAVLSAAAL